jgi:hypothetical protein
MREHAPLLKERFCTGKKKVGSVRIVVIGTRNIKQSAAVLEK